ncbi:uncharacterized protein LOC115229675 [Argonauta hians]
MYDLKRKSCVLSDYNNSTGNDLTTLAKKLCPSQEILSIPLECGSNTKISMDSIESCSTVTNSCLTQFHANTSPSTPPPQPAPTDTNMDISSTPTPNTNPVIYSQPRSCIMCAAGESGHINHILR